MGLHGLPGVTMFAWVRRAASVTGAGILCWDRDFTSGGGTNRGGGALVADGANLIVRVIVTNSSGFRELSTGLTIPQDAWAFVLASVNAAGGTYVARVNATEVTGNFTAGSLFVSGADGLRTGIGAESGNGNLSGFFQGSIDDACVVAGTTAAGARRYLYESTRHRFGV
jgi:hypothetical protein